ncbi:MAG: copper amine oxidase N-terminal domain-containing protein [bacterium]|nr:copper amine oxidase N-terminal domain-containing protein [bacterium]
MLPMVQIVVDGRIVASVPAPQLVGGVILVPLGDLRYFAQRAWYRVEDRSITVQRGDRQIVLFVDRRDAWINGEPGALVQPPLRVGQTLYVPVAVCARALGARVSYEGATHTLAITTVAPPLVRWTPPPAPFIVPTPFPPATPPPAPASRPSARPTEQQPETPVPQPRRTPIPATPSWPA